MASSFLLSVPEGEVAQAADAHDADGLGGLRVVGAEGVEDGGAAALQRGRGLVAQLVGDLEQEGLAPDGVGAERALVQVRVGVHGALGAVRLGAPEALGAVAAAVVLVAPADAFALLEDAARRAQLLDDADALVAQGHVLRLVVQVRSAHARGRNPHDDLVTCEVWPRGLALLGNAVFRALEYCEGRHIGGL
jgi:hypothetical protein